ncbi:hypothetical protein ACIN8IBEIGE_100140 [Acinetobacter sp. 8I-beige]|nr:hypothetical protein ACIN8IBEIGE_100140 [Acinetobacter sp. 8I-beige]
MFTLQSKASLTINKLSMLDSLNKLWLTVFNNALFWILLWK